MMRGPRSLLAGEAYTILARCWPKPDPKAVAAAMDEIFQKADQNWTATRSSLDYARSAPPSACQAGCGWCCHQQAGVSVPEAVRLAEHLRSLPEDKRRHLERRILDTDAKTRGISTLQWAQAKIACPFLGADGSCMVYQVRPLRCRGVHSIDRSFCIDCYNDFESMRSKMKEGKLKAVFLDTPQRIYDSALEAVVQVIAKHAPKAAVAMELVGAMATLIKDPSMGKRWLLGRAPDRSILLLHEKA
jgi:Fe-S-cluster containining protein